MKNWLAKGAAALAFGALLALAPVKDDAIVEVQAAETTIYEAALIQSAEEVRVSEITNDTMAETLTDTADKTQTQDVDDSTFMLLLLMGGMLLIIIAVVVSVISSVVSSVAAVESGSEE